MSSLRDRVAAARHRSGPPRSTRDTIAAPPVDPSLEAIAWAYQRAIDPETVYLDTETTGLDGRAEVVDVAVVGANGRVILETLVRPSRPIPADASAIHGIFAEHVADAPSWPLVYERLRDLLADRLVVVYNAPFDRRLVEQCCRHHGLDAPSARWDCAMRRYAAFHGERTDRGAFRSHKLERAVVHFGAKPGGHRAAADALACRAVVQGMAALFVDDGGAAWTPDQG